MSGRNLAYKVSFSAKALRQLKGFQPQDQKRIKEAVTKLETIPPLTKIEKIKTRPGQYKMRVGDWRIFFRYLHTLNEVQIIAIRPRDHAYD